MRDHYRENLALLRRILAGDQTARAKLVLDNMGLVHFWAGRMMEKWCGPHGKRNDGKRGDGRYWRREELIERGIAGLVEGAAHVENCRHDRIGAFLGSWVRGAMLRPDPPLIRNLPREKRIWQQLDGEFDRRPSQRLAPDYRRAYYTVDADWWRIVNEWDEGAALALIRLLCWDATDDAIIDLRLAAMDGEDRLIGQVAAEVAERLGLHRRTVRRRLWRIRQDFVSHRESGRRINDRPERGGRTRGRQVAGRPHAGNGSHGPDKRRNQPSTGQGDMH